MCRRLASRAYCGTANLRAVRVLLGHAVLAELDEGTAPSTIARNGGVGYATLAQIAETTKRLQSADTR